MDPVCLYQDFVAKEVHNRAKTPCLGNYQSTCKITLKKLIMIRWWWWIREI